MKSSLLLVIFLFAICLSQAQNGPFSIRGSVVDSISGKGIELATFALKTAGTDPVITGATTNSDGTFLLEHIDSGKYQLLVTFVGYDPKNIPVEVRGQLQLKAIQLSSSAQTLGATVVTAERSLIIKNSEKTVFNVAQSPTNQTGTAEDVLRNMPGVSVDQKGNVTIIGKQGVKVLVDGRPNALAQSDLQSFLKSLPASSIEAIELITNPSARYDAEGNAGIINIKLKKGKADGLNGSISAGYGILNRYNGNFVINYRKNKINIFATYGANYSATGNQWIENRAITVNDTTTHYNLNSKGHETRFNNNLKAGLDYFINDKNTLTYTAGGTYSQGRWLSQASSENMDALENELEKYNSTDDERSNNFAVTNDISYRRKFDSTDRELDIDINHTYVSGNRNAPLNSLAYDTLGNFDPANSLYRRTTSANNIHNFVFQLDYIHPLKKLKGYKIEAGAKNETTINRNVFNVYDTLNAVETKDSLLSNNFNYTENITAAYFIMSGSYKKWLSYAAGLRGEYTFIRSNDNSVNKNYPDLFPSASINYAINDTQNLSFSYSRRVQRPQFRQINNTISYIDQYSTWQGNSFLQPSYSNIVSANYTINVGKQMFSFDASGNFQTQLITETSHVDSTRITRGGVTNAGNAKVFNLTFYTKLHLTKWWEIQMNHTYAYSNYGYEPGINLNSFSGSSYNLWSAIDFKCWKDMTLEINGWFNTKAVNAQGNVLPVGVLNASIKKPFLKDRLTVSVAGNNLLNTMKWRWVTYNTGLVTQGSWQEINRVVMITLTYKFGSDNNAGERKIKDGNDRLGTGGGGRG